jgi:hypothetical protein
VNKSPAEPNGDCQVRGEYRHLRLSIGQGWQSLSQASGIISDNPHHVDEQTTVHVAFEIPCEIPCVRRWRRFNTGLMGTEEQASLGTKRALSRARAL